MGFRSLVFVSGVLGSLLWFHLFGWVNFFLVVAGFCLVQVVVSLLGFRRLVIVLFPLCGVLNC